MASVMVSLSLLKRGRFAIVCNGVGICSESGQVYGVFTQIEDKKGLGSNLLLFRDGAMWHGSCSMGEQEIQYETF
jgi:hypothetical protein